MGSLEELLAEEGFNKSGKPKSGPRAQPASRTVSMPNYHDKDRNPLFRKVDSFSKLKNGRTRSDVYSRQSETRVLPEKEGSRSRLARRGSPEDDCNDEKVRNLRYAKELKGSKSNGRTQFKVEFEEDLDNGIEDNNGSRDKYPDEFQRRKSYKKMDFRDMNDGEQLRSGSGKKFQVRPSFNDDLQGKRHEDLRNSDSELALDEAAIQAVVSILTGYARRFFRDEKFRESVRQGCDACLKISGANEGGRESNGAVTNLREAIATVERVAREIPDPIALKKASLKLSVITGLSSKELKDGYTCGIPNSHLVACAHLYLSMIYKIQKKDKVSAKHLLQVFYESPHQARTTLLPRLWDHLFFPHLSHLWSWYDKVVESTPRSSTMAKNLKLLDNVYNNALDKGTCQFAVYYKEWLMDETETPVTPLIDIPSASLVRISQDGSYSANSDGTSSPHVSVSSQPMISKRLYERVFNRSKEMETIEKEDEVEKVQLTLRRRYSGKLIQEDDGSWIYSPKSRIHQDDHDQDSRSASSPNPDAFSDGDEWTGSESSRLDIPEANENEVTSENLALCVFQSEVIDQSDVDTDVVKMKQSANLSAYNLYQSNRSNTNESLPNNPRMVLADSHINSFILNSSAETIGNYKDIDQGSLFSSIPKDFLCPLTGHLFKDPVTLENGQTFERVAVREWFDKGNTTCPITGQALQSLSVPITNFVLKHVIDGWKSEYFRNLLTQIAGNKINYNSKSKSGSALFIIEKLLIGFSREEQMENAKHLISLGGLHFLLRRLELGDMEEKIRVISLILCCIKANGSCRSYLAINVKRACIVELLNCEQANGRTSAVLLLIELICLNRRMAITSFVSSLHTEVLVKRNHVFLVYLDSTPAEERVLVAVLLLHLDLVMRPQTNSIYRDEAVDSIIVALHCCLSDKKIIPNTRRALLMLGGHFSSSGEILTETWLLKQAGFSGGSGSVSVNYEDEVDEMVLGEEEAKEREEWLKSLTRILLSDQKGLFLETMSTCLGSENMELVWVCLITLGWLSRALVFLPIDEIRIPAFSTLIPRLVGCLESGLQIEHRVLASLALHNFSKISECRVLLMRNAEEICYPLKSLMEVTWTAKHLYTVILGGRRTAKKGGRMF